MKAMQKRAFHNQSEPNSSCHLGALSGARRSNVRCRTRLVLHLPIPVNRFHARQQECCRKPLSVDFAIQLAWRFIYPEFLKFTRQCFVAQTARPHRVYQSRLGQLLPYIPNPCLAASFGGLRRCHWSRGLGVKPRILSKFSRIRLNRLIQRIGFLYFSRTVFLYQHAEQR